MKINDSNVHINFEAYSQKVKDAGDARDQSPAVSRETAPVDKVVLSPKAREIQEALNRIEDVPDVDMEKVTQVRRQIQAGTYQIDGRQIAERMMREMSSNQLAWV
jgi:negative regulator of flagellin synthesis FlgM